MKVHLGKFHIHGPKGCSLLSSMLPIFYSWVQNYRFYGGGEFKVDIVIIGILRRTSSTSETVHCWLHVYSIE